MPADTGARANGATGDFPAIFYAIIRSIDRFSDITGRLIALAMVFLVAIISYEVCARYLFNAPTVWVYESSDVAKGSGFKLNRAYALLKRAHVPSGMCKQRYSDRTKRIIDLLASPVPFSRTMTATRAISIDNALRSSVSGGPSEERV